MYKRDTVELWRKRAVGWSNNVIPNDDLEKQFVESYRYWSENGKNPNYRLAWSAAGMVTYGHIEYLYDVIRHVPVVPYENDYGAREKLLGDFVYEFLPLPSDFKGGHYVKANLDEVKNWFEANKHKLVWNEVEHQFELIQQE